MDIEVKIDEKYDNPKIVIYTNKVDEEISNIIDGISSINQKILKAYKDEKNLDNELQICGLWSFGRHRLLAVNENHSVYIGNAIIRVSEY